MIYEGDAFTTVTSSTDSNSTSVFRFFNSQSGTHFYTTSETERGSLLSTRSDLVYEGSSFEVDLSQQPGDVAVYRFFDALNGSHFYTASAPEWKAILATRTDMVSEGIAFYVPQS